MRSVGTDVIARPLAFSRLNMMVVNDVLIYGIKVGYLPRLENIWQEVTCQEVIYLAIKLFVIQVLEKPLM